MRSWILPLIFLLSLPAVTPRIYASDEIQYFAYLRSLWFDRDVSFENEYQHFFDAGVVRSPGFHETFLERTTETGRRINFATIGCAILWAPFYALADMWVRLTRSGSADGYSFPYVAAVAFGSAFYGLLAVWLSARAVEQIGRHWRALGTRAVSSALIVWIGTPLLFYMYVAPPMSHAPSAFAVALFVVIWLHVRESWTLGGSVALGASAGLMAMVREQDAFFVVGPVLDFLITQSARRGFQRREWGHAAAGAAAAALVFLPQAIAYLALNGHVGPSRLVARKMTWTAPHALDVVASLSHGFLIWTPLAAGAVLGLWALWRHLPAPARPIALALGAMLLVQIYVAGSVESWTVAGAFGQRRFVALTVILTIGIASLRAWSARRLPIRVTIGTGIVLACWWNVALMAQFGAGMMNRQQLEPARLAYNSFVVMPRALPGLVWRYVFDRASFYQATRELSNR